jgi:hypothetical protein
VSEYVAVFSTCVVSHAIRRFPICFRGIAIESPDEGYTSRHCIDHRCRHQYNTVCCLRGLGDAAAVRSVVGIVYVGRPFDVTVGVGVTVAESAGVTLVSRRVSVDVAESIRRHIRVSIGEGGGGVSSRQG